MKTKDLINHFQVRIKELSNALAKPIKPDVQSMVKHSLAVNEEILAYLLKFQGKAVVFNASKELQ
jgi:hypothetical protein